MLISIAIASIGRAELAETLASLDHLLLPEGVTFEVVLGDDSVDGKAADIVARMDLKNAPVTVVPVGSRNIATCRNACLEAARGEWIAFIDDDEIADPDWILQLHQTALEEGADAVFGRIKSTYPATTPAWLAKADPVGRLREKADGPVSTGSSGNAMVRRAALDTRGLRFDPAFGTTGGEDTDLFFRLHKAGGRLHFTNKAVVREEVVAAKATVTFCKLRAVRSGQTFARQTLRGQGNITKLLFFAQTFMKMIFAEILSLVTWPFNRSEAFILRLRALMNRGKLREAFHMPLIELYRSKALDA